MGGVYPCSSLRRDGGLNEWVVQHDHGDMPCEEYIKAHLVSEMQKYRGKKRRRKKHAKRVLRQRWLMLRTARLFSRPVGYAEIARQVFTVEPLPNPVEPIYLKEDEE